MDNLFLILAFAAFLGSIYGLINPQKAIFWKSTNKGRLKAFGIYLLFMFIAIILFGVTTDSVSNKSSESVENIKIQQKPQFKIDSKDSTGVQITLRIIVPERYGKDTLIEITRQLKEEFEWKENFLCFFDIGTRTNGQAWASCAYLQNCDKCENDVDKENNPIEFTQIGLTREKVEPLLKLQFDSIPEKKLVASYIDDATESKFMIFKISESKALQVQLWPSEKIINRLNIVKDGSVEKYYYDESSSWYDKERDGNIYWTFDSKNRLAIQKGNENQITYRHCLPNP